MSSLSVFGALLAAWILRAIFKKWTEKNPLDNVPGPPNQSWLVGNFLQLWDPYAQEYHVEISRKYGGAFKLSGLFSKPSLYVFDPKALYHILVKDQAVYEELESLLAVNNVTLGKGLTSTTGEHHKKQRKMLNPVFSMGRMKEMVPIFNDVIYKLRETFEGKIKAGDDQLDLNRWLTRAALELIGQSGLGYSFDPLTDGGEEHPYSACVKRHAEVFSKLRPWVAMVLPRVVNLGTPGLRRLVVDFLSLFWKDLREARDIVDMMDKTSKEIFEMKKKALAEGDEAVARQIGQGKDIISVLMKANMEASGEDRLPDSEVIAQMSTLTFGAMDTTSNALSRIIHILSENQDVQDRLRKEIMDAVPHRRGSQFQYDELMNLPYLDAVIRETMRLYPPAPLLVRETTQNTVLPISKPFVGLDSREWDEIPVPKGTMLVLSSRSSNINTELWGPDALEWKPERWLSPLPDTLIEAKIPGVYSHLMTFLGGGRACIGFKFSELEMKVVLTVLLERVRFVPVQKVVWRMNGVVQPTIDEPGCNASKAQLPMKLELV